MEPVSIPETLECSECGAAIEGEGYLPASERGDGYEPLAEATVCDACGFNAVGMMGCAPELDEVIDSDRADVLLFVRRTDDGFEVVSTKE